MHSLRPYQEKAVKAVNAEFADGVRSTLLVMATGTGKTRCFTDIAKSVTDQNKRVLTLAHRSELIEQAKTAFEDARMRVGIEKADSRAFGLLNYNAIIASVQSLSRLRVKLRARVFFENPRQTLRCLCVGEPLGASRTRSLAVVRSFPVTQLDRPNPLDEIKVRE